MIKRSFLNGVPGRHAGSPQEKKTGAGTMFRLLCGILGVFLFLANGHAADGSATQAAGAEKRLTPYHQQARVDEKGRLKRLHVDTNGDGVEDTFQVYENGGLARIERDTDFDGAVDTVDHFAKDLRVSQDRLDSRGKVVQKALFDAGGAIERVSMDTTGDGRMDTVFQYTAGALASVNRDADADGRADVQDLYRDGTLHERREDTNGDGIFDRATTYADGRPLVCREDLDFDGKKETATFFDSRGRVARQETHTSGNESAAKVSNFENGVLVRLEVDSDGDGFRETTWHYDKGGGATLETRDLDRDGKPDVRIFLDERGEPVRSEHDTTLNGRPDSWQFYSKGELTALEKDLNGDGKKDVVVMYHGGRREKMIRDDDFDGIFESTDWFERDGWQVVREIDSDEDGRVDTRDFYQDGVVRIRQTDHVADRGIFLKEHFDAQGTLVKSEEMAGPRGPVGMVWIYGPDGNPLRAEKDSDGDGEFDIWFVYENGVLKTVSEDANKDGRVDVWEEYATDRRLTRREKDLDYDGVADVEENF